MKSRWEIILLTPPLNSSVYNTSKVNRSECFIITLQCRCFLSSSSLLSRNLRSLIILFLSTSDKWKFQVYNFTAFRQIILYGVVVSQKNIFENKMIHVVYWIDKSYILIPSWYERWEKKYPISKKNVFMAQDDRELLSVSYFKWTMQTSTWHDYLICLGQRVKLGNDVMPTIWAQML